MNWGTHGTQLWHACRQADGEVQLPQSGALDKASFCHRAERPPFAKS